MWVAVIKSKHIIQLRSTSTVANTPSMEVLINSLSKQHQQQVRMIEQSRFKAVNYVGDDFKAGISKLRDAQTSIIQELKKAPTNKQMWDLWLWTQSRELELLQQNSKVQQMEIIQSI